MTDLELTKLCAKAMGIGLYEVEIDTAYDGNFETWCADRNDVLYDPLHDDAQAMAIVKKFELTCDRHEGVEWGVDDRYSFTTLSQHWLRVTNKDLNRAICECVAEMVKAKP